MATVLGGEEVLGHAGDGLSRRGRASTPPAAQATLSVNVAGVGWL